MRMGKDPRPFDPNLYLSKNFQLKEFTKSNTAKKHGIPNYPREECEIKNMQALCQKVLQPYRDILGKPLIITSGFRCPTLNRLVRGSQDSQHMFGQAADFVPRGVSVYDAALTLKELDMPVDQFIYEAWLTDDGWIEWIHVSHSKKNRGEFLTQVRGKRTVSGIQPKESV